MEGTLDILLKEQEFLILLLVITLSTALVIVCSWVWVRV